MRRIFQTVVAMCLLLLMSGLRAQVSVAVGDFENQSSWMYLDSWARRLPDYLEHELSRHSGIVLVERHQLETLLNEQALGLTGLTDSSRAQEVGRLIRADYIITGTVVRDDAWLRINAKVINTTTGKIVTEKVQSRDRNRLDEMVGVLSNNLVFQLAGQGAYQPSLRIQEYPTHLFIGVTLTGALVTGLVHNAYIKKRQDYQTAAQLTDMDPAYRSANRLYKTRNVLIGITSAACIGTLYCWIQNRSPEEILAGEPVCLPYLSYQTGGSFVGVQIHF